MKATMSKDRTDRLQLRLSPTEKEMILKKAEESRMSPSDYIVSLSENRRVVDTKKLPPLIWEIRKIGVNINQIAAVANTQKYVSKETLNRVNEEQKKIIGLLQEILEEVYNADEHTIKSLEHKIDKLTDIIERTCTDNGNSQGD